MKQTDKEEQDRDGRLLFVIHNRKNRAGGEGEGKEFTCHESTIGR